MSKLKYIIDKALDEGLLNPGEIEYLLRLEDKRDQERLFAAARKVRSKYFGDKIFAYGFVYFSTYCQNDCKFCFYRNSNPESPRYRKDPEEVLAIAEALSESGVHLIDLTMGEDPLYYRNHDFSDLLEIVSEVKANTELPVMASFGLWPEGKLEDLRVAGADWYACYQETHTPDLYRELRVNQDFNSRLNFKSKARQAGFLIEDGILLGVGESIEDRVRSVKMMSDLEVDQGRVMSFVPQSGTPLSEKRWASRIFRASGYCCLETTFKRFAGTGFTGCGRDRWLKRSLKGRCECCYFDNTAIYRSKGSFEFRA